MMSDKEPGIALHSAPDYGEIVLVGEELYFICFVILWEIASVRSAQFM